jgi:hypothetical protein
MRTINEMTEQEILKLTDADIQLLIKYEYATQGIKIMDRPQEPEYFEIDPPDRRAFSIDLFNKELCFEDISELNKVIELLKSSKSITSCDSEYVDGKYVFISKNSIKRKYGSYNAEWSDLVNYDMYSAELYAKIKSNLEQNSRLKKQYDSLLKEYNSFVESVKEIRDGIYSKYYEVINKHNEQERLLGIFKRDYYSIAEGNYDLAMKFMDKAYTMTDEQKKYIDDSFGTVSENS